MSFFNPSIGSRLWLVLAIVLLPLIVLAIHDYRQDSAKAKSDIEREAHLILDSVVVEEEAALRQVRQTLLTIAASDNLQSLSPEECNGIAKRMLSATEGLSNIGGVLPNGDVFCSAKHLDQQLNVADREWFKKGLQLNDVSNGYYLLGRITRQPNITFSYPLFDSEGKPRALLFLGVTLKWFDRFTSRNNLPAGWTSVLFAQDGTVISRFPDLENWRNTSLSTESLSRFIEANKNGNTSVEMLELDGTIRIFFLQQVGIANNQLIVSVAAPIKQIQEQIEQVLWLRIGQLALLMLFSILVGRYYLYRLIESWIGEVNEASTQIAKGKLATRLATTHLPKEFTLLNHRFNNMAAATEARETQHLSDQREINSLNVQLATKLAELEATNEHLHRLSTAVEQSPASIVITDVDAKIIFVNDSFVRTSGFSAAEAIGRNPRILQSGETNRATYESLWPTLVQGNVWRGEFLNKRKDGSHYLERASISPVRNPEGEITHYVAVKEDITERRIIEAELLSHRQHLEELVELRTYELAVTKEAAEAANRAKSEFLANMSHEIRTPMNVIIGLNYLLLNTQLQPEQRQKLIKVSAATEHLLRIINDILDLSKIEAGKQVLEHQDFSPAEVMSSVLNMVRDQALGKGLDIEMKCDGLPNKVYGDATRLRQILLNFTSNAVKFTQSGSISLSGEAIGGDTSEIICRFSVTDTGIGINLVDSARLFTAFEQVDSSTTRHFGGTGLGLAIAHHLAKLMGGEVGVDSTPGVGSRFWVTARLGVVKGETLLAPTSLETVKPGKKLQGRVLLVEDEAINREIGKELLLDVGLQVETAENGNIAVNHVKRAKFDLILMDLQMPGLDGLQATRQIRQLPCHASTPIIALTANAFATDKKHCFAAGMTDFLSKPVEPDQLYAVLGKYLSAEQASSGGEHLLVVPKIPIERAQLINELSILAELMSTGSIDAVQHFNQLGNGLKQLCPVQFVQLQYAVSKFEFEKGLALIDEIQIRLAE